jgi:hypothetical protein
MLCPVTFQNRFTLKVENRLLSQPPPPIVLFGDDVMTREMLILNCQIHSNQTS